MQTSDRALYWQQTQAVFQLAKPRVVLLIVFCAVIGMFLATPDLPNLSVVLAATIGIGLVAGAAAMINCLVESNIDARMRRTAWRATAKGDISALTTLWVAATLGGFGMTLLFVFTNALTAWLTLMTFVGYAIVYTLLLKPNTPQNIVIGGASGAMPPVLGWVAVTGQIDPMALVLFLIIYTWTPPHFWALALYRRQDYQQAGLPMLPVTHGQSFTTLSILLYTFLLTGVCLMPVALKTSGWLYFVCALALSLRFIWLAFLLHRHYADNLARKTFKWSIWYLMWIFAALLLDHSLLFYLMP